MEDAAVWEGVIDGGGGGGRSLFCDAGGEVVGELLGAAGLAGAGEAGYYNQLDERGV